MKLELGNYEMDMISHEPLVYTLKGCLLYTSDAADE